MELAGAYGQAGLQLPIGRSRIRQRPLTHGQSPVWTVQAYAQYETPPVFGDAFLTFRMDGNYRSKYNPSVNTPLQNTVSAATGGALPAELLALYGFPNTPDGGIAYITMVDKQQQAGGFWLANGRVSLSNIDLHGTKARISAFVQNMFNEKDGKGAVSLTRTRLHTMHFGL